MATITLNPIIMYILKKIGSNVFLREHCTRMYDAPTNRNTEAQVSVRSTFLNLVNAWKSLGKSVQNTWNIFANGKNLTGYNAFIGENFGNMKADLALIIAKPMEEEPLSGFTAQPGSATGEIRCSFATELGIGKELTLFTQKKANGNGEGIHVTRYEAGAVQSPATLNGLEPGASYHVYAVVTDGPYATAKSVSQSVHAETRAGS